MSIERRVSEIREERRLKEEQRLQAEREFREKIETEKRERQQTKEETVAITREIRQRLGLDNYINELRELLGRYIPKNSKGFTEIFDSINIDSKDRQGNRIRQNKIVITANYEDKILKIEMTINTDGKISVRGERFEGELTANDDWSESQFVDFLARAYEYPELRTYYDY